MNLSKQYQFSSIGGTSAGAIAAAVTAAAEYARAGGRADAFEEVARLPEWLGGTSSDKKDSNLFHLFQSQPSLAPLYNVATAGLGKNGMKQWFAILLAALIGFPVAALVGVVPSALVAWVSNGDSNIRPFEAPLALAPEVLTLIDGRVVSLTITAAEYMVWSNQKAQS